jgi:hypothetical protein
MLRVAVVLGCVLVALSCGSAQRCTPGETQSCFGPGACNGGQSCLLDGSGFSRCDCGLFGTGGGFVSGNGGGSGAMGGGSSGTGGGSTATGGGSSGTGGGSVATGGGSSGTGGGSSGTGGGSSGTGGGSSGTGGGGGRSCTLSQTCPANACICGDSAAITSQYCLNGHCQSGPTECARACAAAGHPAPGGSGGGTGTGGGSGSGGGTAACNGAFALGSNFTTGNDVYLPCNQFPSPTNCLTGKYINFEGVSGPLAACYCYAVCPNGVSLGQDCLSNGDGGLICTAVRNTAGTSAAQMCLPPGAAWQNLCRG